MKLKRNPSKPIRKTGIRDSLGAIDLDGQPIEGIEEYIRTQIEQRYELYFKRSGLTIDSYDSLQIEEDHEYDYDGSCYTRTEIYGIRDETDSEFNTRMKSYRKRKTEYDKWYKENKEEIEAFKAKKEKDAREALEAKQAREIAALEKKLERLKKK